MSTRHVWVRLGAGTGLAMALFLSAGCGDEAITTDTFDGFDTQTPEMSMNLAAPDGGTGIQSESPAFGDAYMRNYLNEDERVAGDPLAADARLSQTEDRPGAEVFYLRVVWGNLRTAPGSDEGSAQSEGATDWTGYAEVNDGLLLPARTISFDRGDHLVPPWRSETVTRQRVEWVSHTLPHVDGILFRIVVPAAGDSAFAASRLRGDGLTPDDSFTFSTGPLTVSFPLQGLADLDSVIMVDEKNGVSFSGFDRHDVDRCPRGMMVGAWVKAKDDTLNGGFFRAKWAGAGGELQGHVRGRWGVLEDGSQVFVGKLIGRRGEYSGHIRGQWERSAEDASRGTYQGGWYVQRADGSQELRGRLQGVWSEARRVEEGGFLKGVWRAACGEPSGGATE